MNYVDFANSIRTKYPGAYDNIDDKTLAQRVTEKYPQYQVSFDDVQSTPKAPINQPKRGILGKALDVSNKLFDYSPTGIMANSAQAAQKGFDMAGGKAAELIGGAGFPKTGAAVGFGVSMIPDAISSIAAPTAKVMGAAKSAVPMARRALGFQKSLLKTPFARGQATKAAETALEEGVIPITGSPTAMLDRASELANKSGERIKTVLKDTPVEARVVFDDLEALRQRVTKGAGREGNFKGLHEAIDRVSADISDFISAGKGVRPSNKILATPINELKNRLGNSVNYLADIASQGDNKGLVKTLANTIRNAVKNSKTPQEFAEFLKNQKLSSSALLMKKGLNNEVAGQMGNAAVSLPGAVVGAGRMASGDVAGGLMAIGLFEGAKRRGAGAGAALLQGAHKYPAATIIPAAKTIEVGKKKPKKVIQNGHVYVLNEQTGEYE